MKKIETLTSSEWKLMRLLWRAPMTVRELEEALQPETGWSKHAIISFLKRMQVKKTVAVEESDGMRRYVPLLREEETIETETRSAVERLFHGDAGLMVSKLIEREEFTPEEIDSLMELLHRKKGENG